MKNIEDVAVIVQARLSSQRCPRKMIRDFNGTTLMDICLSKLTDSTIPDKNIWLSVYEPELIQLCSKYPLNVFTRSEQSAMSEGTPMTEIYEWWNKIPHKYVVLVNACAPFLKLETIEKFYFSYCNSAKDGMFGVIDKKNYFWDKNNNFLTPLTESVMNTKTADVVKEAAHCLYASKLSSIGEGVWMGDFNKPGDIDLYSMDEKETFDIDYEWEFELYKTLWGKQ